MSFSLLQMLNKRKGPAVQGPRAQIDRTLYKNEIQRVLFNYENLSLMEGSVEDLAIENHSKSQTSHCCGIVLQDGRVLNAKTVILTTGTFLRGQICVGLDVKPAGRMGDEPSIGLAKTLEEMKFQLGRLKTGKYTVLIHETNPQSRPAVITIFISTHVVCLYVRPNFSKFRKKTIFK